MKKRSLLLIAFLALFGSATFAQKFQTEEAGRKESFQTNRFLDNWFIGAGPSATWYANKGIEKGAFFKRPTLRGNLQVGKWLTPTLGTRVRGSYGSIHSFSENQKTMVRQDMWTVQADMMFDLSNYFMTYTPDRFYHFIAYLGAGGGQGMAPKHGDSPAWGGTRRFFTVNGGIINKFQFSQAFAIDLEIGALGIPYDIGRIGSPNIDEAKWRYNALLSAGLNFIYTFKNGKSSPTTKFYEAEFDYYGNTRGFVPPYCDSPVPVVPVAPEIEFLPEITPSVAIVIPQKVAKILKRKGQAYLDFPVGQTRILADFRRNPEELAKINAVFNEIKNNEDARISYIYIEGYASPEGAYSLNERLATERAASLKEYIKEQTKLSSTLFKVGSMAEDWDGLVALIKQSTSEVPYKQEVLNIIENVGLFDARKEYLKRLGGGTAWRYMLKEFFPLLRKVEYQVDYTIRDYTLEEAVSMYSMKPENLSAFELYQVAMHFGEGSTQYNNIMTNLIPKLNKNDYVSNINAAAVLIQNNDLKGAKEKLKNAGDSAEAINNLGVLLMYEGDLDTAEKHFLQAQIKGSEAATKNLEAIKVKRNNILAEKAKNNMQ